MVVHQLLRSICYLFDRVPHKIIFKSLSLLAIRFGYCGKSSTISTGLRLEIYTKFIPLNHKSRLSDINLSIKTNIPLLQEFYHFLYISKVIFSSIFQEKSPLLISEFQSSLFITRVFFFYLKSLNFLPYCESSPLLS